MPKKKTTPVVVRLTNFEEIFGYGYQSGNTFTIETPMTMQTQEGEQGETYIFMTHLDRYSDEKNVKIDMQQILYIHPMSKLIQRYYERSIKFVDAELDKRFISGIEDAIKTLDKVLKKEAAPSARDLLDSVINPDTMEVLLMESPSKRCH